MLPAQKEYRAVYNPGQVRDFAKATGRVAKTDKLDEQDIAHFGEALKPELTTIKSDELRAISDLLAVRSQCLEMSTMQKNRLKRMPKSVHKPIQNILKSITKEIATIDKQLDKLIDECTEWREKRDLLLSVRGCGACVGLHIIKRATQTGTVEPQTNRLFSRYSANE